MFFLCASFGAFFIDFSNKITAVTSALIVKYGGVGAMFFAFLTITPFHDLMIVVSSVLVLLSCFYITVFVLKSKGLFLKLLSIVFMSTAYVSIYVYFRRSFLDFLPMLQKITFLLSIIWVLSLVYFTRKEDFELIK